MLGRSCHGLLGNRLPDCVDDRQRTSLPLGACVGGVVSTTGDLVVVTQYRLWVVSLWVLVGKDMPAADREWSSSVSRIR